MKEITTKVTYSFPYKQQKSPTIDIDQQNTPEKEDVQLVNDGPSCIVCGQVNPEITCVASNAPVHLECCQKVGDDTFACCEECVQSVVTEQIK
jgi:hypothetical protein